MITDLLFSKRQAFNQFLYNIEKLGHKAHMILSADVFGQKPTLRMLLQSQDEQRPTNRRNSSSLALIFKAAILYTTFAQQTRSLSSESHKIHGEACYHWLISCCSRGRCSPNTHSSHIEQGKLPNSLKHRQRVNQEGHKVVTLQLDVSI
jgi:hypothetical protein